MADLHIVPPDDAARYSLGRRVTVWGMILNILLSAFKIASGIIGGSQAIIADGIHSLSDLGSDIVVLVGLKVSSKPSDESHHYGHAKFESLATLAVAVLLVLAGVFIGYESFRGISEHQHAAPGILPIVAAGVSIFTKELLYRWTKSVGKKTGSSSLEANAWHHRTDALTSVAVLAGLVVARVYPSLEILDHLIALVVAVFVVQVAVKIAYRDVHELLDSAPSPEVMNRICGSILEVEGVRSLHKCRARRVQGRIHIDVHIQVPGNLTVLEGHRISGMAAERVRQAVPNVMDVLIHIEPIEDDAQNQA